MDQKFVSFDDAVTKLGISSERLTKLREEGQLRAYRDGASWKFRTDEIERLAAEGLPDEGPASDISLVGDEELMPASQLPDLSGIDADDDDLKLADDDDALSLEGSGLDLSGSAIGAEETAKSTTPPPPRDEEPSELDLELEDTVTADGPSGSDSILLSEEELGEAAAGPPPSTIIGRDELEGADLDLQLDDDGSDVKLAPQSGAGESHVLSSGIAGSGVLSDLEKESGATDAFADLEELEIDLSAESSRVLAGEGIADVADQVKANEAAAESELELDGIEADDEGTDPVPAAVAGKKEEAAPTAQGESDIELASEEDFVLADQGGSDITLDSGDSGINLISPSDSGLALDDIPLDVGGSAILSSLSLEGEEDVDISLVGSDIGPGKAEPLAELEPEDNFNLTPMASLEDEGDSSSQVIALDAEMEGLEAEAEGLDAGAFVEVDEAEMGDEAGLGVAAYGGAVAARRESEYGVGSILALGCTALLLAICGILLTDMIRNIWGWQEGLALNSWILDGMLGMFGLRTQ